LLANDLKRGRKNGQMPWGNSLTTAMTRRFDRKPHKPGLSEVTPAAGDSA